MNHFLDIVVCMNGYHVVRQIQSFIYTFIPMVLIEKIKTKYLTYSTSVFKPEIALQNLQGDGLI
jgi:hypothetical protein